MLHLTYHGQMHPHNERVFLSEQYEYAEHYIFTTCINLLLFMFSSSYFFQFFVSFMLRFTFLGNMPPHTKRVFWGDNLWHLEKSETVFDKAKLYFVWRAKFIQLCLIITQFKTICLKYVWKTTKTSFPLPSKVC